MPGRVAKNSEAHSSERRLSPFRRSIPHPNPHLHLGLHLKKGYHYTWVEQTISPKESPKFWNQSKSKSLTDVSNEKYFWKNAVRASGKEWGSKALDKKAPLYTTHDELITMDKFGNIVEMKWCDDEHVQLIGKQIPTGAVEAGTEWRTEERMWKGLNRLVFRNKLTGSSQVNGRDMETISYESIRRQGDVRFVKGMRRTDLSTGLMCSDDYVMT